ncbi:hypothetical protein FA95DRAFT_1059933 [Auriscalpium vulgare]|uniref:Uncharacterized protein n=1 Tax=Auriscalpium vulgare TaxID=40419 RepID=A0ACB8SAW7_9AGAM|nr:hypothetical protein FA95DRAFT_1059933 [Auriscalpium vulgare]
MDERKEVATILEVTIDDDEVEEPVCADACCREGEQAQQACGRGRQEKEVVVVKMKNAAPEKRMKMSASPPCSRKARRRSLLVACPTSHFSAVPPVPAQLTTTSSSSTHCIASTFLSPSASVGHPLYTLVRAFLPASFLSAYVPTASWTPSPPIPTPAHTISSSTAHPLSPTERLVCSRRRRTPRWRARPRRSKHADYTAQFAPPLDLGKRPA